MLWRLLVEFLAFRLLLLLASGATGSRPLLRRSNTDVDGREPSLSLTGNVLWATFLSVNVFPTLCFTGVRLTCSSKTNSPPLGGVILVPGDRTESLLYWGVSK